MPLQVQARRDERELVISGQRTAPVRAETQTNYRRRVERSFGSFSRTFNVRVLLQTPAFSFFVSSCTLRFEFASGCINLGFAECKYSGTCSCSVIAWSIVNQAYKKCLALSNIISE